MKKLLSLALSTLMVTTSVSAAIPMNRPGSNRHAGKIASTLNRPTDFNKKPFKQLVPTRNSSRTVSNGISGLQSAPSQPAAFRVPQKKATPKYADIRQMGADLQLRGCVLYADSWMMMPPVTFGLYTVPTAADADFEVIAPNISVEYGAYDDGNGSYYVASLYDFGMGFVIPEVYVYSTETWEETDYLAEPEFSILCTDNAVDPVSGAVYGCYYDTDYENLTWARADYPNGKSSLIKVLAEDEKMMGVACDSNGQFYAILADGRFVKVDKNTGDLTTVGDTGLRPYYGTSATFDTKSNSVLFCYAPATQTGSMWSIEPATGAATLLLDFPDNNEVTDLVVIGSDANPAAPAAPSLEVTAPEGTMEASYTITMPTTIQDGSAASGNLAWSLMVDGDQVAEGTSAFGQAVNGTYTLTVPGMHTFTAIVTNDAGKSPKAQVEIFIGKGSPKAPAELTSTTDNDGNITLKWTAVTEAADGGYINPSHITYTVTRNGETLKEGLTATSYNDQVSIPDTFRKLNYEVKAVYDGKLSEAAVCSTGIGAITPPYADAFTSQADADALYTALNENNDNVEWYYSAHLGCFKYDYNDNKADDWLISPAFHLEKGKLYELSFSIAAGHQSYTERYAFAMGTAPTAAGMTTELIPPVDLTGDTSTPQLKTVAITPDATGNYYFGWHALSEPSQFMIQLKDVKLSAPMAATSPDVATAIELTADADGQLSLSGKFNAPTKDISGNALQTLSKIIVTRTDKSEPVKEFSAVSAGSTLTFSDTDFKEFGTYTYVITAYDNDGNIGRPVSASIYVGPVTPENVPSVTVVETSTLGEVTVSWEAPKTTVAGTPLKPENLTYMVYVADANGVAQEMLDTPTSELSAKFTVCSPDEQKFALFYVKAFNLGLESEGFTRSAMTPVGKPDQLPYRHSFDEASRAAHLLGYTSPEGSYATWSIGSMADGGITSQDGDDAYVRVNCPTQYARPELFTGKIAIGDAANPAVSLYHYIWSESDRNGFDIIAVTSDGKEYEIGGVNNQSADYHEGWNLTRFSLASVKGMDIKLVIRANIVSHENMLFDNLQINDLHDIDIAATAVSAPARVEPDKEFTVRVTVANLGLKDATGYTVGLLLDGKEVATADGAEIPAGTETYVDFRQKLSPVTDSDPVYTAIVTMPGDQDATNNSTPVAATPQLTLPKLPAVADLSAARTAEGATLTWSAPSTAGFEAKPVEDFEDAASWTEEVDGWTMIDRDEMQIGTLEGAALPDAVGMRTRHAFFVFDKDDDDIFFWNEDVAHVVNGHSGSKSLVAMYILNPAVTQDDWAISPTLDGKAQKISFYARSFHPEYTDHMEVLYSTSDSTDPDDFVTLCNDGPVEVPQLTDAVGNAAYTLYEYDLPEGAMRFAIRAINEMGNGFMLMIDDVKFGIANPTLEILGYDIYRDGTKINPTPVTGTSYTDNTADTGSHTYHVLVNYNRGLSPASNAATLMQSGIGDINADGRPGVNVAKGTIFISGISSDINVNVYAADGLSIFSGQGQATIHIPAGAYIVKAGAYVTKVMVP